MVRNAQHFLAALPINVTPQNQGLFGQSISLNIGQTVGTIAFWAMGLCILGFILGAALYAFSARNSQNQLRSHEAVRLILGSLIGIMLFGGLSAITGVAYTIGGKL
ncbi:MAG: hypothetical protein M1522_08775 [Actinobacteria bacterium]|nr:hypothetical protein [Actinomycetota bacterium]